METLAVIEIITIVLAIPLSYLMAHYFKKISANDYRDQIDSDYLREWNGESDDEYYAWIRIRHRYINQDSPGNYFRYIDGKMGEITKRGMLSTFSISKGGDIVPTNSFKEKDTRRNTESRD